MVYWLGCLITGDALINCSKVWSNSVLQRKLWIVKFCDFTNTAILGTVYFLIQLTNDPGPLMRSGECRGRKTFCIVLLVWFCLEDATRCFKEEHMATGPALHVLTMTNLITAPPTHATGAARHGPCHAIPAYRRRPAAPRCLSLVRSPSLSLPLRAEHPS
jgi:hypothetical protein